MYLTEEKCATINSYYTKHLAVGKATVIVVNDAIFVSGDYSLDIRDVTLDDDAKYQCQVSSGPRGEPAIRSRYARLTVLVPPEPPKILEGNFYSTTEDRMIKLECVSVGGKPPAEVKNLRIVDDYYFLVFFFFSFTLLRLLCQLFRLLHVDDQHQISILIICKRKLSGPNPN
ncbi:unnamed protein product [Diatraea saccharalis]|uniref:Ig-like domain-containing protein n=1 Tax=Diatraea saccharalis TaxID=40085 RepID=A0A9P0C568_9NEOP|nr:unnamed protein product [Diatraea saccharalis]